MELEPIARDSALAHGRPHPDQRVCRSRHHEVQDRCDGPFFLSGECRASGAALLCSALVCAADGNVAGLLCAATDTFGGGRLRSRKGCSTLAAIHGSEHVVVSAGRTKHENLLRANRIASGWAQHPGRETGGEHISEDPMVAIPVAAESSDPNAGGQHTGLRFVRGRQRTDKIASRCRLNRRPLKMFAKAISQDLSFGLLRATVFRHFLGFVGFRGTSGRFTWTK
jgi:hypothetical protein